MSYTPQEADQANFNFIDEDYSPSPAQEANFNFTEAEVVVISDIFNILAGTSNHFTSVWAYGGKMYVASSDAFSVVNLASGALIDYYTQTFGGNNNETLIGDDVVDINANM